MAIDWEKIVTELSAVFQDEQETFARVLFYLGEEEKVYKDADKLGPQMKILMSSMKVASLFSQYAKRLAEDTKRADSDEKFKRVMGPVGMIIGGIGGGMLGGQLAKGLSQWMTEKIFDVPKSEALENAYNFFNLRNHASNHQINTAYRQKCLEYHPDKGGSEEKFHKVQMEMAVIKAAKGELYS
uniref:Uncharacterized protein LOC114349335 n=1 Tax=Diabrotica virgifera virgifera TaxID=50390 RepID=A0A6P7HIM7_DIAVI